MEIMHHFILPPTQMHGKADKYFENVATNLHTHLFFLTIFQANSYSKCFNKHNTL